MRPLGTFQGNVMHWTKIEKAIAATSGKPFTVRSATPVAGGCINDAFRLESDEASYFVKLNRPALLDMFTAEAAGLQAIRDSNSVRAPLALCWGKDAGHSYLVMEHLETAPAASDSSALLGEQLAHMHRDTSDNFGWFRDNYIGATAQPNQCRDNWMDFFCGQRLSFQLELAASKGAPTALADKGQRLLEALPAFFSDYRPPPSLLHGDLWGGNWACSTDGRPVIFDPAVYYGDREADLAMTELFGGFDQRFYDAYQATWPLDGGYGSRKTLYNLYHILNHYNLFGGAYASQARDMIEHLLAELH